MTDIDTMPAGREMDALVAEMMGISPRVWLETDCACAYCGQQARWCGTRAWCSQCSEWRHCPYKEYSDEIDPAWEVVEKMSPFIELVRGGADWVVIVPDRAEVQAETAPLAICRAALKAVEDNCPAS